MVAIRKSRLLLSCNSCSLRFASFTPWACMNGIFVSIVFFATYDDTKGSTFIYLGRDRLMVPYRHRRMSERQSYDAHTIVHITWALWGNRANIMTCLYSDRRNRMSTMQFFWMKNITESQGDRIVTVRQSCGLLVVPVRCCLRWIYRLRCLRRIVGIQVSPHSWKYWNFFLLKSRPWEYLKRGQVLESP